MGRGDKRTASNDWKASQFLRLSLIVTALSIMFFFAGRSIFNKMDMLGGASQPGLLERAAIWGGFVVQKITLDVQPDSKDSISIEKIQQQLEPLHGMPIFSVNLVEVQDDLVRHPWIESIQIRRELPDELKLDVRMREAALILRATDAWIFADKEGVFLSASRSLSGKFLHLPRVFGLETRLNGDPEEMNRLLGKEKDWVKSLTLLVQQLEKKVRVEVLRVDVEENDWMRAAVFNLSCRDQAGRNFKAKFPSQAWESRISSFQYVLSDQTDESLSNLVIDGRFPDRWYITQSEGGR